MVKKKNNIPALRYSGFEEEWSLKRIGDIGEIITGNTPPTENEEFYNGDYLFVSPYDINETRFLKKTKTTVTKHGFLKGRRIRQGSILFVCIGSTIGKIAQNSYECITNQQINSIIPINNNDDFIYSLLEKHSLKIKMLAAEQAVPIINKTTFSNYTLNLPSLPEQQKIASFLTAVDERIQQLTRKKKLLEKYKKGVMQKIFSREIRFKDDKGKDFPDWEVKFAKDIFKNHTNKNHNGDLPILAATQDKGVVYRDSIDIKIQSSQESINTYKIVEVGDFVISLRSFQGGIEYSKVYGICSPAYTVLKPKIEISNEFFRYYFKRESFIQQLSSTVIGIRDGKQISYEPFSGLKLLFPTVKEQEKIGSFITAFENKIELVNTQLQKTQAWKKGLLQKMFV